MLRDRFGRGITYLRLSVTDQCNLRCAYCMPFDPSTSSGQAPLRSLRASPPSRLLSFEEIERLVRILTRLGIRRVRLTGGEPLVRRGLPPLIEKLSKLPGMEEVLLTTNGLLLKEYAQDLWSAGLRKINIHLDTLCAEKYQKITGWGKLENVLGGIEAAKKAGFDPIKLNMVVQRGLNDNEIEEMILFAKEKKMILRLIELMPIGPARHSPETFISLEEIRKRLEKYTLLLSPNRNGSGPAVYYKIIELNTILGFISPVSRPFCENCDRIRISADGRFQDCLAFDGRFSLRDLLRDPRYSDVRIERQIEDLIGGKREWHDGFSQEAEVATPCMYGIGG